MPKPESEYKAAPLPLVKRLMARDIKMENLWDEFVLDCPQASFFHRSGWQKIVSDVFHHTTYFLYAEVNGVIKGVLPLAHVKSWMFGQSLVSLPFAVYGGVASCHSAATESLVLEAQRLAKRLGVAHLEFRNLKKSNSDWPVQDLYVTFRKTILPELSENMKAIPRKQRAMVRKGMKNGLSSRFDNNVETFFKLYSENVHRHGTPALSKGYFTALRAEFGADCEILTVIAPGGQALSSVLSFYFRDEILPYYAGDTEDSRHLAANDFKYWELLRHACEKKVKVFDYGRSKVGTGSYFFKKNWGFEPQPLFYEYCLYKRQDIPSNNPSNVKFKWLIEAWRKIPIELANSLGPFIVRNLG
jgi:FemAB-related protein (PEP-CTERM system-associated)